MAKNSLYTTIGVDASGMKTGVQDAVKNIGELKRELMKFKNESFAGKTSAEITEINRKIGELNEQMADARAVQKGLAGDFGALAASGLQGLTAVAEVGTAVGAAFGFSEESGEKFQKTMVQLIGVSQGLAAIEQMIGDKTLISLGIRIKEMAVMAGQKVATVTMTAVQWLYNAALGATIAIITGGIAVVVALVAGIWSLVSAMKVSSAEANKNKRAFEALSAAHKTENDINELGIEVLKARGLEGTKLLKMELANLEAKRANVRAEADALSKIIPSKKEQEDHTKKMNDLGVEEIKLGDQIIIMRAQLAKATDDEAEALKKKNSEQSKSLDNWLQEQKKAEELAKFNVPESNILFNQKSKGVGKTGVTSLTPINPADILTKGTEQVKFKQDQFIKSQEEFANKLNYLNDLIKGAFEEFGATFAEGIAGLVTGDVDAKGFGKQLLGVIGNFLGAMGKAILSFGVAMTAFQEALKNIFSPVGAVGTIAAGIALIAAGAIVKNLAAKGVGKYAAGGIVGGSLYSGDKVPIMVNSGEMVLNQRQQANLFSMANGGYGAYSNGTVTFKIQGSELVGVLNNYGKQIQKTR